MNHLELKSPHDGALLILDVTDRFPDSVEFTVQVRTRNFSGSASSSTFMAVPLETWFQGMADDWAGWKDEKKWADLESRVQLCATADKTGHIRVKVVLAGQDYDSELRVNIMFEAGQLEGMAHDVARLFAQSIFRQQLPVTTENFVNMEPAEGYMPPQNRAELERRYAAGERCFPNTDLSEVNLAGITLDDADFEKHSWFADADFTGASLRGTSFKECNLKCANFSNSDLTGAILELAAIESIKTNGAALKGVKVRGATFYGCELSEGDELPSWDWQYDARNRPRGNGRHNIERTEYRR